MVLDATIISLKVVIIAITVCLALSIGAVFIINNTTNRVIKSLHYLILLPMFIPPSALGYIILVVFGRRGAIGKFLNDSFGVSIIFTITAAIIAAIIVTLPIMYQSIKSAIYAIDEDIINAAKICGAGKVIIFIKIILPLSYRGIINGLILCFARAFGEFGATILVAGNIPGKTQTLPMSLYYAMESGNSHEAKKILLIILTIALILMNLYSYFTNRITDS